MATPKLVRQKIHKFSYDIDGLLSDLIVQIQSDLQTYTLAGWTHLTLNLEDDDYGDSQHVYLYGFRLETVEQAEQREIREQQDKDRQEKYDREQFERLSKKFAK